MGGGVVRGAWCVDGTRNTQHATGERGDWRLVPGWFHGGGWVVPMSLSDAGGAGGGAGGGGLGAGREGRARGSFCHRVGSWNCVAAKSRARTKSRSGIVTFGSARLR